MTHEEIKILISAYIDGEVTPSEKNIVEEHLSSCAACQKDYKDYTAISSSLSKWSDETLSPDEEINVQKRFEQRREPMFTKRTLMTLGTTLALTIIIGSVVQTEFKKGVQGRLKSAADDLGDQYSNARRMYMAQAASAQAPMRLGGEAASYEPYYLQNQYALSGSLESKRLGNGLVGMDSNTALYGMRNAIPMQQLKSVRATPFGYNIPMSNAPDHKVIKNANITVKVKSAEKAQTALEGLVAKYNGVIDSLNINKSDDGSMQGVIVFSVSPKDLDILLPELRKLGEIQSENQSGSDVTSQYASLEARLSNYMATRDHLRKMVNKSTEDVEKNLYLQGQLSNVEANIDAIQSGMRNIDDQSYMATVTVNFYDTVETKSKEVNFKDKLINSFKDNIKSTLQTAYDICLASFSGIFIVVLFLIQIAIWVLLFWGVYLLVRKVFKK